ncbi:MAG: hypothetical protein Q8O93_01285 [bacterium]|nr:hypothetical protein [bacterium]
MITLNLVSDKQKKEIRLRHLYGFIKKINLTLTVVTITAAIILLTAKIILQLKFNDIVEQTTLVTKNNQGYNNKVRGINAKINFVEKIQEDFFVWSDLLKTLADIAPKDINLYYLKINAEDQTFKIKGKAGWRESLLTFKEKMDNLPILYDIDFPIKNILEKENIDFEINAKLKLDYLQLL